MWWWLARRMSNQKVKNLHVFTLSYNLVLFIFPHHFNTAHKPRHEAGIIWTSLGEKKKSNVPFVGQGSGYTTCREINAVTGSRMKAPYPPFKSPPQTRTSLGITFTTGITILMMIWFVTWVILLMIYPVVFHSRSRETWKTIVPTQEVDCTVQYDTAGNDLLVEVSSDSHTHLQMHNGIDINSPTNARPPSVCLYI